MPSHAILIREARFVMRPKILSLSRNEGERALHARMQPHFIIKHDDERRSRWWVAVLQSRSRGKHVGTILTTVAGEAAAARESRVPPVWSCLHFPIALQLQISDWTRRYLRLISFTAVSTIHQVINVGSHTTSTNRSKTDRCHEIATTIILRLGVCDHRA